ncbi:MAG: hypothetical protein E4H09_02740, partial [Spirochaetales bacterium]
MSVSWLDWFGYAASVVILVSLTMSSIIRLRWINLAGAAMFATFGYLIGSIPTGTLNLGIVFIDIFYLVKLYRAKDALDIVEADPGSAYFEHFWKINRHEIDRFSSVTQLAPNQRAFYFLRNNNTAGILVGHPEAPGTFRIDIDYVAPEYRDFTIGLYFIAESRIRSVLPDVTLLLAAGDQGLHSAYLRK